MADLATLQTWLTEAQTARHKLLTGTHIVEITSPSGERVAYTAATSADLDRYIGDLNRQIANASATPRGPVYGLIDFRF